jgi:hypothetical protein
MNSKIEIARTELEQLRARHDAASAEAIKELEREISWLEHRQRGRVKINEEPKECQ